METNTAGNQEQEREGKTKPRPSPLPTCVLRGHGSGVTHAEFIQEIDGGVVADRGDAVDESRLQVDSASQATTSSSNLLVSGDEDGEIRVWDFSSRRVLCKIKAAHSAVAGVQTVRSFHDSTVMSHTQLDLVSQGRDGRLRKHTIRNDGSHSSAWLLQSESATSTSPPMAYYTFCKISPVTWLSSLNSSSTKAIIAKPHGADNKRVVLVDMNSDCIVAVVPPATAVVGTTSDSTDTRLMNNNCMSGDGSAGQVMSIHMLRVDSSHPTSLIPNDGWASVNAICCCYEDGSLSVWDVRSLKSPLVTMKMSDEPLLCAHITGELISPHKSHRNPNSLIPTAESILPSMDMSPSCSYRLHGLAGGAGSAIYNFTIDLREALAPSMGNFHSNESYSPLHLLRRAGVASIDIFNSNDGSSAHGRLAAAGCWDGSVRLFDIRKSKALAVLKYHTDSITHVSFQPKVSSKSESMYHCKLSPCCLSSCSRDGSIAIWQVEV